MKTLLMQMFFTAFPDIHFADNESEFKNGKVYHHWIGTGTQKGKFMGNAPTGKKFTGYGLTITSYNDEGELLSDVTYNDMSDLCTQLGITPPATK